MPRKTNNRAKASHGGQFRGGRGRGGNSNRGRGQGRGRGRGRGRGQGRGIGIGFENAIDFPIQNLSESDAPNPRGRGRSRPNSGYASPLRGVETPRGRGRGRGDPRDQIQSPRSRGRPWQRGRGNGAARKHGPLSNLLYAERPFLKPIIFVPSVHTPKLFENEADEDLLQPQVEDVDDDAKDHIPTADHVFRIFSGGQMPPRPADSGSGSDDEKEGLEEINFEDMARIREELVPIFQVDLGDGSEVIKVEDKFTGIFCAPVAQGAAGSQVTRGDVEETTMDVIDSRPTSSPTNSGYVTAVEQYETTTGPSELYTKINSDTNVASAFQPASGTMAEPAGFYIDTTADRSLAASSNPTAVGVPALGEEDDEEIIVYVAPHPRVNKPSPPLEPQQFPSQPTTSILTGTTSTFSTPILQTEPETPFRSLTGNSVPFSFTKSPTLKRQARTRPVFTVGARNKLKAKAPKKDARVAKRRLERKNMFRSFGAIMSEAQLRGDEELRRGKDPRWEERRRGDSDIDWGEEDEDDSVVDVSNGVGAMELDTDIDLDAMKAFVNGMSMNGGRHVTMDDIADEERMKQEEKEDPDGSGSDSDDVYHCAEEWGEEESSEDEDGEAVMFEEEELIMGEPIDLRVSDDDDSDSDCDDDIDIDQSPNTGFQARLQRLRKNSRGKTVEDARQFEDDTSDDDFFYGTVRGDEDDDFISHIESLLDNHSGTIDAADRKARNRLFRAVQNGDFSDFEDNFVLPKRKKDKHLPEHLRDQWNKDRAKKAKHKKARAQARLEAAADPLTIKKGGKKGRKAMLAAAKFDPTVEIPHRVFDLNAIEQQIRRFIYDVESSTVMSFPPMEKQSRKQVHELALAFNLKSHSKGKGEARYTTLTKTSRSGIMIDEQKIRRMKRSGMFMKPIEGGSKGKGKSTMPKHREGEEVGKAAPKIGEANIGFKMLASMGWAEGDRIGNSGGLHAPLTAVIKNTKLGLGATR